MIFSSLATTIRTNERTTLRLCTTFIIIHIYIYILHTCHARNASTCFDKKSPPRFVQASLVQTAKEKKKKKCEHFFLLFFFFHQRDDRKANDGKRIRWRSVVLLGSLVRSVLPSSFSFRLSRRRLSLWQKRTISSKRSRCSKIRRRLERRVYPRTRSSASRAISLRSRTDRSRSRDGISGKWWRRRRMRHRRTDGLLSSGLNTW